MDEGKTYKNTRTGEISKVYKIMQSSWDEESNPEAIKDFFSYSMPDIKDCQNGDIIVEVK